MADGSIIWTEKSANSNMFGVQVGHFYTDVFLVNHFSFGSWFGCVLIFLLTKIWHHQDVQKYSRHRIGQTTIPYCLVISTSWWCCLQSKVMTSLVDTNSRCVLNCLKYRACFMWVLHFMKFLIRQGPHLNDLILHWYVTASPCQFWHL